MKSKVRASERARLVARSPGSSSFARIRSAHLPDQQSYQARNGDGSPWVLLNPRLHIAFHGGELVLRDRGRLRQAVPGSSHDAGHLVARRGDLFLSEIGNRLGQLCGSQGMGTSSFAENLI